MVEPNVLRLVGDRILFGRVGLRSKGKPGHRSAAAMRVAEVWGDRAKQCVGRHPETLDEPNSIIVDPGEKLAVIVEPLVERRRQVTCQSGIFRRQCSRAVAAQALEKTAVEGA